MCVCVFRTGGNAAESRPASTQPALRFPCSLVEQCTQLGDQTISLEGGSITWERLSLRGPISPPGQSLGNAQPGGVYTTFSRWWETAQSKYWNPLAEGDWMGEAEICDSTWKGCLVWAAASHHRGAPSPLLRSSGSYGWRELPECALPALMKWGECIMNNRGESSQSINFYWRVEG